VFPENKMTGTVLFKAYGLRKKIIIIADRKLQRDRVNF